MIKRIALVILTAAFAAGCGNPSPAATPTTTVPPPAATRAATAAPAAATATSLRATPTVAVAAPTASPTLAAAATAVPAAPTAVPPQPTAAPAPSGSYLDDRSSPDQLVRSLFDAVNQRQYARAYSYWIQSAQLAPFDQFSQGYAQTASVQVKLGTITSSGAAGSIYYSVPVALLATTTAGAAQSFAGCYTVRLVQPGNFGTPPITPMSIEKGSFSVVPAGVDPVTLLGKACADQPGTPVTPQSASATDIGASRYVDDRSTAESTLRSLFNAINRREYVRAYSYWNDVPGRQAYAPFSQGYANTAAVQLTTGPATLGAAAGNLYWQVPVTLVAQTSGGQTQTFVGCYTLHLAQPALQTVPPYQPMGIEQASVQQTANGANTGQLMAQACAQ